MALHSAGTASDRIQSGTTAQRPTSTEVGQIRFNTTTSDLEFFRGDRWVPVRPPVDAPIKDTDRTLGLNFNRGLHLVGNDLETHISQGLQFNADGSMRVVEDGDISLAYKPLVESYTTSDLTNETQGGPVLKDLPGTKSATFRPPYESNAGLCITACKIACEPLRGAGRYTTDGSGVASGDGAWNAHFSGRGCFAATAAAQERIGAHLGMSVGFPLSPDGEAINARFSEVWNFKVERLEWDKNSNDPIVFNFTWPNWTVVDCVMRYGAYRAAICPFTIS